MGQYLLASSSFHNSVYILDQYRTSSTIIIENLFFIKITSLAKNHHILIITELSVSIPVLVLLLFGTHLPSCHVQQLDHQVYLGSLPQYRLEGLPSCQTAPEHPLPCTIPFIDVGKMLQLVNSTNND